MILRDSETEPRVCPFIDLNDSRCARHFTLTRLGEAFELCLKRHSNCVTFYHILRERRQGAGALNVPFVRLTLHGQLPSPPPEQTADHVRDVPAHPVRTVGLRRTGS